MLSRSRRVSGLRDGRTRTAVRRLKQSIGGTRCGWKKKPRVQNAVMVGDAADLCDGICNKLHRASHK